MIGIYTDIGVPDIRYTPISHVPISEELNVSIPSCAGELGRNEERTEVVDGVCPAPGP